MTAYYELIFKFQTSEVFWDSSRFGLIIFKALLGVTWLHQPQAGVDQPCPGLASVD